MPNGRLIGDRVLPESVTSRRRQFRSRLQELREPIRSRREDLVPGPDIIGRLESSVVNLRDRFTSREGLLSRIRAQRGQDGGQTQSKQDSGDMPDV